MYTFGSDFYGCLGVDEGEEEVTSPVCVPTFAVLPVLEVSCGDNHVAALTRAGDVYTWGCGEFGRESTVVLVSLQGQCTIMPIVIYNQVNNFQT